MKAGAPMKSAETSTSHSTTRRQLAASALALVLAWAPACEDDDPLPPNFPDVAGMTPADGGTTSETGLAPGGAIPPPPDGAMPPPVTVDADYIAPSGCCMMELSIADSTGDETVARLYGDQEPLNSESGLPLTYSDGRWRAKVCLPLDTLYTYRFYFGTKMVPPSQPDDAGVDDAGAPDAGAPEDAGEVDSGVDEDAPPSDSSVETGPPDPMLVTIEDYRTSDEGQVIEVNGAPANMVAPLVTCDLPPMDSGPPPPK